MPPELVKPYTSDVVSVIANFARLSQFDQNLILGKRGLSDASGNPVGPISSAPRYSRAMLYLYQYIKQEKPYFEERINPGDFSRVFVVEPQQSSERLRAQSGAFLISALHKRFERVAVLEENPGIPVYAHYKLDVAECKHKANMMRELELLNISGETSARVWTPQPKRSRRNMADNIPTSDVSPNPSFGFPVFTGVGHPRCHHVKVVTVKVPHSL